MKNKEVEKLIEIYAKQKLAHIYLIETNNQDFCFTELLPLIKTLSCPEKNVSYCGECSVCHQIDKNFVPNLIIIEPTGKNIKKEQILELKRKCSLMPSLAKNNVYIIKSAEKLNASSANTMLKFMEEPFDNCYGFLITNNQKNILPTIKSRVQVININSNEIDHLAKYGIDEKTYYEYLNILEKYLFKIEVEKKANIMYNKLVLNNEFKEIKTIESLFKIIYEIYNEYFLKVLNLKNEDNYKEFDFIAQNSPTALKKKRELILNLLQALNYNINIDLFLDRFIIEMGEINE